MNYRIALFKLINGNNFLCVNRDIARIVGINSAIMLSSLIDDYLFWESENKLIPINDKMYFYMTHEKCEERTTLSRYQQDSAIKTLEDLNIISKVVTGYPQKRYFTIHIENLLSLLDDSKKSYNLRETDNPICEKLADQSAGNSQIYIKPNNQTKNKTVLTTTLPPPTIEEFPKNALIENGGGGLPSLGFSEVKYKAAKGNYKSVSVSYIFSRFIESNIPTEILSQAIQEAAESTEAIADIIRYIEGICHRLMRKKKHIKNKKEQPIIEEIQLNPARNLAVVMKELEQQKNKK